MRVKTALFCSLSTSNAFQTWLYEFDENLYKGFIRNLKSSRGCDENKRIMMGLLEAIEGSGGAKKLEDFLIREYPHIIDAPGKVVANDKHKIFDNYVQGVLTYPRREIIRGGQNLERDVKRFLTTKIHGEYIIVDDVAYIEYLLPGEEEIAAQLPDEKWKVRNARRDKTS